MRAYIAAPIFDEYQLLVVNTIQQALKELGFGYFSPYEASQDIWKGRKPSECSPAERGQVLEGNISNLFCDLLVAWVGGYDDASIDTGVVWELGFFAGIQKCFPYPAPGNHERASIAFVHERDPKQKLNLMLAGTVDAVAKGWGELYEAIYQYKLTGREEMIERFNPARHFADSREPIV